jgi:phospholipid/cholesterol/gamma-HCH transport system ATP-binding protein
VIEVKDLHVSFGPKQVLTGLNLTIEEGVTTVIIGRSGIGKSVTLKCILGLIKPDSGSITIEGEEFLGASRGAQLEMISKIGMLLQHGALFDSMSIYDNIAFPLAYHKKASPKEIEKRVKKYAEIVEIEQDLDLMPSDLSGGMKRRAALARAIILEPKYLFYDEPTTGLDPTSSALVDNLIRRLTETLKITTVVVTHDIEMVRFIADKVALLQNGRIDYIGNLEDAFREDHPIYSTFINQREIIHREQGYLEKH